MANPMYRQIEDLRAKITLASSNLIYMIAQ
jgi:hypothetical protein